MQVTIDSSSAYRNSHGTWIDFNSVGNDINTMIDSIHYFLHYFLIYKEKHMQKVFLFPTLI